MKKINSIATAGIFSAIYAVFTILAVYVTNVLGIFSLIIMPIFCAYYCVRFNLKEIILFNVACITINFIVGFSNPFYVILYVLPTLFVGISYGLLSKIKIGYYGLLFYQSISFAITNLIALYLGDIILETNIISILFPSEEAFNNFSLSFLFIISAVESIVSTSFIFEKLELISISNGKETIYPLYGYITNIILIILSIPAYFLSNNFYFLFMIMLILINIPFTIMLFKKVYQSIIKTACMLLFIIFAIFILCALNMYKLVIPFTLLFSEIMATIHFINNIDFYIKK